MKTKKEKLKDLLGQLETLQGNKVPELPGVTDDLVDEEVTQFAAKLKGNPMIQSFKKFSSELSQFKEDFKLDPLIESVKGLSDEMKLSEKNLLKEFENRVASIHVSPDLTGALADLRTEFDAKLQTLRNEPKDDTLKKGLEALGTKLQFAIDNDKVDDENQVKAINKKIEKAIQDINNRIASIGGGSMNRKISINGVDPLTRYTDINLKAGSNVTINYVNNNTTKQVDITFIATGGGSGGGIARSINSVSTNTNAGFATATDYVYLASGTMTLTLPDATSGNTNLYTIKNVGTGVVTVNTTSSQTIDGNLTIQMATQYTSIDIESDTANWNIT
jgi:hypothetical protein